MYKKESNLKNEKFFIYGKHAVFAALSNLKRKIDVIFIIRNNEELKKSIHQILKKNNRNVKLEYVENNFFEHIFKSNVKHQGIVAKAFKLNLPNYNAVFQNSDFKYGVILDGLTDANNTGAIYRSAKAFGIDFIINSSKNTIIENNALLNTACGAFETTNTFIANNISNAIKKFISEGWWIIGLDHGAEENIEKVISKMKLTDKLIFVFGSEGKGIRRLIKKNCNFIAKIPNTPNTHSINVSNAAAIIFYETFKMRSNILY